MKLEITGEVSWFYLDKSIQILYKTKKEVKTLVGQELDYWLEIDKNNDYVIMLQNLYAQIPQEKEIIKINFDSFIEKMIMLNIFKKT